MEHSSFFNDPRYFSLFSLPFLNEEIIILKVSSYLDLSEGNNTVR